MSFHLHWHILLGMEAHTVDEGKQSLMDVLESLDLGSSEVFITFFYYIIPIIVICYYFYLDWWHRVQYS